MKKISIPLSIICTIAMLGGNCQRHTQANSSTNINSSQLASSATPTSKGLGIRALNFINATGLGLNVPGTTGGAGSVDFFINHDIPAGLGSIQRDAITNIYTPGLAQKAVSLVIASSAPPAFEYISLPNINIPTEKASFIVFNSTPGGASFTLIDIDDTAPTIPTGMCMFRVVNVSPTLVLNAGNQPPVFTFIKVSGSMSDIDAVDISGPVGLPLGYGSAWKSGAPRLAAGNGYQLATATKALPKTVANLSPAFNISAGQTLTAYVYDSLNGAIGFGWDFQ